MVAPTGVVVHRCMYVDQAKEKKDFSLMDDGRRVYFCTTYENPTEEQHRFHLRGYSAQHDTARYIAHTHNNIRYIDKMFAIECALACVVLIVIAYIAVLWS